MLELSDVKQLVRSAEDVYVSTINEDGYPVTRVMFNLHSAQRCPKQSAFLAGLDEDFCIYLGTNTASTKTSHIKQTSKMSVYYHVQGTWQAMLVGGEAEIVTDMAFKRELWQDEWLMYYKGGIEGGDFTVIRIRPVFAEHAHDLTKDIWRSSEGKHEDQA